MDGSRDLLQRFYRALDGLKVTAGPATVRCVGSGHLPSVFAVTDLAVASLGVAAAATAELIATRSDQCPRVLVDRRLASMWFATSIRPQGWQIPPIRDPLSGDYQAADGWLRIHANAPTHRAAAVAVLGAQTDKAAVSDAVSHWRRDALEDAIVQAGGCAAAMHTRAEWTNHPQGAAVATDPIFHVESSGRCPRIDWPACRERPLRGVRVLDLTRVIAAPVATRFLAGLGAEVLRIDAPSWDEPGVVPDVTLGKRCARIDLQKSEGHSRFCQLLAEADVFVHGLRPDVLSRLDLSAEQRWKIRPGLVDVCLDAYGWTGPWAKRRGFDSLVQMSCGIAEAGMEQMHRDRPTPLPVQALDHATGYLMAAAAIRGLSGRLETGLGSAWRTSLATTAAVLLEHPQRPTADPFLPETPTDLAEGIESTGWGPARRLKAPVLIEGTPLLWEHAAGPLGAAQAEFRQQQMLPV